MQDDTVTCALEALRTATGDRPGLVNHLIEDPLSTERVRRAIAFCAEMHLHTDAERHGNAMSDDAIEGLGWVLLSCSQALGLLEPIRDQERQRARVELQEVRT